MAAEAAAPAAGRIAGQSGLAEVQKTDSVPDPHARGEGGSPLEARSLPPTRGRALLLLPGRRRRPPPAGSGPLPDGGDPLRRPRRPGGTGGALARGGPGRAAGAADRPLGDGDRDRLRPPLPRRALAGGGCCDRGRARSPLPGGRRRLERALRPVRRRGAGLGAAVRGRRRFRPRPRFARTAAGRRRSSTTGRRSAAPTSARATTGSGSLAWCWTSGPAPIVRSAVRSRRSTPTGSRRGRWGRWSRST